MVINKPYLEVRNNETFLISLVRDEITNLEEEIHFSVENQFSKYLCYEVADAFVVAMLLPSLVSGQDISVNAPISQILFYKIKNSLIYTLCKAFDKKPIQINAAALISIDFNPTGISTGFSGGIDSFTTFIQHTSNSCPESLRLTHLSLFNVGSYGNDVVKSSHAFRRDSARAKEFADFIKMPLVLLNSNISTFYTHKDIYHFASHVDISIIAGVLSLQKLYKVYLIASGYKIDQFMLNKIRQPMYESLVALFLSGFNTQIIIANADIDRIEKTRNIVGNELVQKFLYVCASDIYNEKSKKNYKADTKPNCTECDKCIRTSFTLEVLGMLGYYSERFDLLKYEERKQKYIISMLNNIENDHFYDEIKDLMIELNYTIPFTIKVYAFFARIKSGLSKVKLFRYLYFKVIKCSHK